MDIAFPYGEYYIVAARRMPSKMEERMKYSAVLFDLDGTLLYTLEDIADALNRTLEKYDMPVRTLDEVRAFVGNGSARLVELSVPADCGDELRQRVLSDYRADYDANCDIKTRPYDGIADAMRALKAGGCRLAVVSNKPDAAVKALSAAHFPGLLESAVGEGGQVRRKPAPDTVLAAMAQLNAGKDCTVYVGDSEVDVLTAKNAGVDCISVCWGFRSRAQLMEAGARRIIDRPDELAGLIM
jgi:phosphoglycolate phosphatase